MRSPKLAPATGCASRSSTTCAGTSATASSSTTSCRRTTCGSASAPTPGRPPAVPCARWGSTYFCFLSAIDWKPSPYGRGEDDPTQPPPERTTEVKQGYAGGETRFQVFARVTDTTRHVGVTLKADIPEPDDGAAPAIDSWHAIYAGANWHERETHEMFGITFNGHPDLRNLYLPTEFEGYPLRKDFPLLARMVKPWPGIVDVEPMPTEEESEGPPAGDEPAAHPETAAEPGRRHRRDGRGRARPRCLCHRKGRNRASSVTTSQDSHAEPRAASEAERRRHDRAPLRAPAAVLHRRAGRRRPAQRRARDRGDDPQHRSPAPGDARHAAHHRAPRRRAGRVGRAVAGLHAPRLREAHRGAHLPAGHDARQPHRLARQLRQRGAVHPRRREADGDRGAAAGAVHPHDPVRAVAHRQHHAVPRRPRRAARRRDAGVLRLPRPRARAQPHRVGHRRALPPQLRPHRRAQGRPARRGSSTTAAP